MHYFYLLYIKCIIIDKVKRTMCYIHTNLYEVTIPVQFMMSQVNDSLKKSHRLLSSEAVGEQNNFVFDCTVKIWISLGIK